MPPKLKPVSKGLKKKAPQQRRTANQFSSFTKCPACQSHVAISLVSLHLDLDCTSTKANGSAPPAEAEQTDVPQQAAQSPVKEKLVLRSTVPKSSMNGYHLLEEFISCEEEQKLLYAMDMDARNPWKPYSFTGLNRGKSYGLVMALGRRQILAPKFEMPHVLQPILDRMRTIPLLANFFPNEMNTLEYLKNEGHFLKPHVDDRQLSGTLIVNLSLCGECYMTFKRERGAYECYKIKLKPRSLQILSEESRYSFTHEIENQSLLSPRRVSMTFREVIVNK